MPKMDRRVYMVSSSTSSLMAWMYRAASRASSASVMRGATVSSLMLSRAASFTVKARRAMETSFSPSTPERVKAWVIPAAMA